MPNPDAILLKKFFDGKVIREWFYFYGGLHTLPKISVKEYKSYFTLYMKQKLDYYCYYYGGVTGRDRMYKFICELGADGRQHIDRWQVVHDALCNRDRTYDPVSPSLDDILEFDVLALPGFATENPGAYIMNPLNI
jgi:hypothetical protein